MVNYAKFRKISSFSQIFGGPFFLRTARPHWSGNKASNHNFPSDAALQIPRSHFKPCSNLAQGPVLPLRLFSLDNLQILKEHPTFIRSVVSLTKPSLVTPFPLHKPLTCKNFSNPEFSVITFVRDTETVPSR